MENAETRTDPDDGRRDASDEGLAVLAARAWIAAAEAWLAQGSPGRAYDALANAGATLLAFKGVEALAQRIARGEAPYGSPKEAATALIEGEHRRRELEARMRGD